jgi:hypothetical protein
LNDFGFLLSNPLDTSPYPIILSCAASALSPVRRLSRLFCVLPPPPF